MQAVTLSESFINMQSRCCIFIFFFYKKKTHRPHSFDNLAFFTASHDIQFSRVGHRVRNNLSTHSQITADQPGTMSPADTKFDLDENCRKKVNR